MPRLTVTTFTVKRRAGVAAGLGEAHLTNAAADARRNDLEFGYRLIAD